MKSFPRNSNVELLRILCMLMVVSEHLFRWHNMVLSSEIDVNISSVYLCFSTCAVNVFVLISGYFGISFKLERFTKIWIQTWFWSVFGLLISLYLGVYTFQLKTNIFDFFPVYGKRHWFITVYLVLYGMSPFLNKIFSTANKKQVRSYLFISGLIFYLWPTLCYITNAPQLVPDAGYGIVNFINLYILGRYIGVYCSWHSVQNGRMKFGVIYFVSCFCMAISQFLLTFLFGFRFTSFISYNTVFVLFAAIGLFGFFLQFNFQSRLINAIAKNCLAVYLIHSIYLLKYFYNRYIFENITGYSLLYLLPCIAIFIYFFSIAVEQVRLIIFRHLEEKLVVSIVKRVKSLSIWKQISI